MGNSRDDRLYKALLDQMEGIHKSNMARIRSSYKALFFVTVVLLILRWLTDSDKVVFMLLWIVALLVICGYIIFTSYTDHEIMRHNENLERFRNGSATEGKAEQATSVETVVAVSSSDETVVAVSSSDEITAEAVEEVAQ